MIGDPKARELSESAKAPLGRLYSRAAAAGVFPERFLRNTKALSAEDQAMFTRAGIEAQQANLLFSVTKSEAAKQNMIKEGVEYMEIEDEDKWSALAVEQVWPKFYDSVGGKAEVDKVVKVLRP